MKFRTLFLMVPVLVVAPAMLQAQSTEAAPAPQSTKARAEAQAQSQAQVQARTPKARIEAAMSAAAKAKVPTSLLASKVAEGEAKNVPEERIATAVEARAKALIRASETMERAKIRLNSDSELSVGADALEAGVSETALINISKNASAEHRVVAIAVLTDLVRVGEKPGPAFARVNAALASSVALANLQAEVASKLRLGGLSSTLDATGIIKIR